MPEATQDSSAATAWVQFSSGQEWTPPPDSLRVNTSRLLQRVIQCDGSASTANQTTQRRTEHLWLTKDRVEEECESVMTAKSTVVQAHAAHEENEATGEAAASVIAALDCWQAAETCRGGQQEGSRGPVHDEVLDNLLKSVEDFDTPIHIIITRGDKLGADGWFGDFRQAMERATAGIAQ